MDAYADFIETAKALKLEKFVFQDFSLQYNFGSDAALLDIDWEAVRVRTELRLSHASTSILSSW